MRTHLSKAAACLLVAGLAATPARAIVNLGDTAPNFTKNELDYPTLNQVTPRSLADYAGKVIVFFLLGYG